MTPQSSTLKVPGASLYYEMRGSGPVLLIIPGGPQDAGVFADVAGHLADRYTVVAYDPRGNSRSTFDGEPQEQDLNVHGDDAARLIEALGAGPAYVFGTSGGAQIGLNLAARHPGRVRALVAHEPPSMMLLDDPSPSLAGMRDLHDTYRSQGVEAAMQKFFSENGLSEGPDQGETGPHEPQDGPPSFEPSPEEAETFARVSGNFEYWLAHGVMPLSLYHPDRGVARPPGRGRHRRRVRRPADRRHGQGAGRQARQQARRLPRRPYGLCALSRPLRRDLAPDAQRRVRSSVQ
ncbi:alpha/beta hydrolase [Mesorhizobium sp. M0615]|uniref:alpha/beta fold hydrolase n=1 Tax=Mesorhizobium sp. M0615 TaxID=2956971 RepID=UPI00333DC2F2